MLIEGLQGRLWDGKENLLISLQTVCVSHAEAIEQRSKESTHPGSLEVI